MKLLSSVLALAAPADPLPGVVLLGLTRPSAEHSGPQLCVSKNFCMP